MIEPTEADIGRKVVYRPSIPPFPKDKGVIAALSDRGTAWVKFSDDKTGGPGLRVGLSDLYWLENAA